MCIGKNVSAGAEKVIQKLACPTPSWYMPAGDLREPVVEAAEQREHRRAEDDEVEVGDDEVGVGRCWSNGIAANMIPESPPRMKKTMKPAIKSSGVRNSAFR